MIIVLTNYLYPSIKKNCYNYLSLSIIILSYLKSPQVASFISEGIMAVSISYYSVFLIYNYVHEIWSFSFISSFGVIN